MRTAAGLLVLLMAAAPALAQPTRDRTLRTLELIEELRLDEATTGRLLPAAQAARARVILFAPPAPAPAASRGRNHRRGDLFPPGSPFAGPCDPFGSMHGC